MGRVELANGFVSVDARSDGLMLVSAVNTLRFGVGSAVLSPRTTRAWLDKVSHLADSLRSSGEPFGISPELRSATDDARLAVSFTLAANSLREVVFYRADGVQIGLLGTPGDTSLTKLIELLGAAVDRTVALTMASADSSRLRMSDAELTAAPSVPRPVVAKASSVKLADRMFMTFSAGALAGLAGSYANFRLAPCKAAFGYCRWRIDNPGFAIGSPIGVSLTATALSRGGSCSLGHRLFRSGIAAAIAGIPGNVLAHERKQISIAVTPGLQAIAVDVALRSCRSGSVEPPT
jgi:hypothetical protein